MGGRDRGFGHPIWPIRIPKDHGNTSSGRVEGQSQASREVMEVADLLFCKFWSDLSRKDSGLGQDSPKTETRIWQGESNEPRSGKESTTGDPGGVDRGRNRSLSRNPGEVVQRGDAVGKKRVSGSGSVRENSQSPRLPKRIQRQADSDSSGRACVWRFPKCAG